MKAAKKALVTARPTGSPAVRVGLELVLCLRVQARASTECRQPI